MKILFFFFFLLFFLMINQIQQRCIRFVVVMKWTIRTWELLVEYWVIPKVYGNVFAKLIWRWLDFMPPKRGQIENVTSLHCAFKHCILRTLYKNNKNIFVFFHLNDFLISFHFFFQNFWSRIHHQNIYIHTNNSQKKKKKQNKTKTKNVHMIQTQLSINFMRPSFP